MPTYGDIHVDLLEGAEVFNLVDVEVAYGPDHACRLREEVEARVLSTGTGQHKRDLKRV